MQPSVPQRHEAAQRPRCRERSAYPWLSMSSDAEILLREALDLPLDERAQLAAELAASLEAGARRRPRDGAPRLGGRAVKARGASAVRRRPGRALARCPRARSQSAQGVTLPVEFSAEATAELEDAAAWYESQRAGYGETFVAAVDTAADNAAAGPARDNGRGPDDQRARFAEPDRPLPVPRRLPRRRGPHPRAGDRPRPPTPGLLVSTCHVTAKETVECRRSSGRG